MSVPSLPLDRKVDTAHPPEPDASACAVSPAQFGSIMALAVNPTPRARAKNLAEWIVLQRLDVGASDGQIADAIADRLVCLYSEMDDLHVRAEQATDLLQHAFARANALRDALDVAKESLARWRDLAEQACAALDENGLLS